MFTLAVFGVALAIGVANSSQPTAHRSSSTCLGPDVYSRNVLHSLKELATSTDPVWTSIRTGANVPSVGDSSFVVSVTDSATCAAATRAFNNKLDTIPVADVYLFKVGSVFVASNPSRRPNSTTAQLVMDSTFHYLGFFLK